ncbi:hypothetical protein [uncultured Fibrella sp.]|uniref:hypothetical protein n=1 Tax=uncultured Fibrella sp. TaxID=1284596 RepID=UPI0035CA2D42
MNKVLSPSTAIYTHGLPIRPATLIFTANLSQNRTKKSTGILLVIGVVTGYFDSNRPIINHSIIAKHHLTVAHWPNSLH